MKIKQKKEIKIITLKIIYFFINFTNFFLFTIIEL